MGVLLPHSLTVHQLHTLQTKGGYDARDQGTEEKTVVLFLHGIHSLKAERIFSSVRGRKEILRANVL